MGHDQLATADYISFATYRKSGIEVATPVWFAPEDNAFYIFSAGDAGKVKRLRNSGKSRIAACTVTGKVTGDWVDTEAELLEDDAGIKQALGVLRRKYGWKMLTTDFFSALSGKLKRRAYIRITPTS